jgi:MFS family permease
MTARTATAWAPRRLEREGALLLVAAGAAFLALLDTTVANLTVADVRTDFAGALVSGATWIVTTYTFAALPAPAERVADMVGRRALMLAGVGASAGHRDEAVADPLLRAREPRLAAVRRRAVSMAASCSSSRCGATPRSRQASAMTPGAIVAAVVVVRAGPVAARPGVAAVIVGGALVLGAAGLVCVVSLPESPSFLTFWLPVGVLIGVGTGAITTGVSTAAALSAPPERFAAAVGLNQTGRQVAGALGVAVPAALLGGRAGSDTGVGPFADVYLFCTLATFAVAAAVLWLVLEEKT